jgi:DNA polymerase alpha-associated DNA helicase A
MAASIDIPSFAGTQLSLLEAELQAELEETALLTSNASPKALQRAGLAILNLSLANQRTGLGGKTVLELELDSAVAAPATASSKSKASGKPSAKGKGGSGGGASKKSAAGTDAAEDGRLFPEHGIRTGDIVAVQELPTGSAKKKEKNDLKSKGVEGVVVKVRAAEIQVACDKEEIDVPQGRLWV